MVRRTIAWLVAAFALSSHEWAQTYLADEEHSYVPIDLINYPNEVREAHPSQQLTIFYPHAPPTQPNGLYPTLLYSPAACFQEAKSSASFEEGFGEFEPLRTIVGDDPGGPGGPAISGGGVGTFGCFECPPLGGAPSSAPQRPTMVFLAKALDAGWAVVTVGSTGHNSWPTCTQLEDCNSCNENSIAQPMCAPTGSCRDTNLWFSPDSAEWDDFNIFWGEKDFTWARQWVALNAAAKGLDNDRVVVAGTSTGAIYASFLAFGPNRAWDDPHSEQYQQDTRVAAIVAFEPNTWTKALWPGFPGLHWASSTDPMDQCDSVGGGVCYGSGSCYNQRAPTLGVAGASVAEGLLEESSISRWIRTVEPSERLTPAFIATSNVASVASGFLHNANQFAFEHDYDRYSGDPCDPVIPGLVPGDPLLAFASINLHDSWYAMTFERDLQMLDAAFHERYSRLFLQENTKWNFLPKELSRTGAPPQYWQDVMGLDGVFDGNGKECVDNPDLAAEVICWMESVVGLDGVGITSRHVTEVGGSPTTNLDVYSSPTVRAGLSTCVEVDLRTQGTDYESASVLIFTTPYEPGLLLSGGQALLCDISSYLFSLPFTLKDSAGAEEGIVHMTLGPAKPAGLTFSTQVILVDQEHLMPFALTNALDITVQLGV